jgi:predicted DNA-binding transcriptional regulator YafY
MSSRHKTLTRVLKVLARPEGGRRYALPELAEEFDVHPRTIRRDLYALEDAGWPIGHGDENDDGGGYNRAWWLHTRWREGW